MAAASQAGRFVGRELAVAPSSAVQAHLRARDDVPLARIVDLTGQRVF
jgi:hypothetical protein